MWSGMIWGFVVVYFVFCIIFLLCSEFLVDVLFAEFWFCTVSCVLVDEFFLMYFKGLGYNCCGVWHHFLLHTNTHGTTTCCFCLLRLM